MRSRIVVVMALLGLLALAGVAGERRHWFGPGDAPVADGNTDRAAEFPTESNRPDDRGESALAARTDEATSRVAEPDTPKDQSLTTAEHAPIPLISAETASALMREQLRERDCQLARRAIKGDREQRFEERDWHWLPPERAEAERQALAAVVERLRAACPPEIVDAEARRRHQQDNDDAVAAAARAGNLLARVRQESRKPTAKRNLDEFRALMIDTLNSGDLEAISELGWLDMQLPGTDPNFGHLVNPLDLWPLVACDLGADCGPGSRLLDLSCATAWFGMTCGYDSLEAAYRDNMQPQQWQRLDQRRNEILNRLRNGQTAGMFDPPPERTGSSGG